MGTGRTLLSLVKERRLKYIGHAERNTKTDLMKTIFEGKPEAKRGRGRPSLSYVDQALRTNTTNTNAITLEEKPLEEVQEFIYLGSKITADGDCIGEIKARISKAYQAFVLLRPIWKTPNISTHTKIRIFRSNVLSVLLYGAECWKMTKSLEQRLEVFQNKCLRRILKIFWPHFISNEDLRGRTGLEPLDTIIKERRWRWSGHVCRRPQESLIRRALGWAPQGQRSIGRPKETWGRTVEKDLKERGLSLETPPLPL
ncbi:hypothetical protein ElyMa_002808900 [Elysia marginata]|uniref:DUF6451 domain-containing protein n=1 Tax=Elysia marginata TaxID=1093978 RepID=A0AAV4HQH2_9GAST|nr:hypothetical protein ElyMa_002808900 [Elysia marginata]